MGTAIFAVLSAILAAADVALVSLAILTLWRGSLLRSSGVVTEGRLVGMVELADSEAAPVVRYITNTGPLELTVTRAPPAWGTRPFGSPVAVRYLPTAPTVARIDEPGAANGELIGSVVGLLILLPLTVAALSLTIALHLRWL